jgi:alpha-1,2-mannosyltransferase
MGVSYREMGLWPHVTCLPDDDNPNVGTTGLLDSGRAEAPLPGRRGNQRTPIRPDWPSRYSPLLWAVGIASAGSIVSYYCLWLSRFPQMDLLVYRAGGQHVLHESLYSSQITVLGRHLAFTYPPLAALLFSPFSLLSAHASQILWDVVDIIALTALIAVSVAAARRRPIARSDWRLALLLVAPIGFFLWPVRYNLNLGQINVVLSVLIVTDLTIGWSWRTKKMPTGVLVGLAAAIKLTPLVFIAYLLASRQWKAARNALLSFAGATLVLFAVAPTASWVYFTKDAYAVNRIGNDQGIGNQTLLAALHRTHVLLPSALKDVLLLSVVCGGVALATMAYRRSSAMLAVLVCATTGLLVSPISWPHHYVWIVPGLIWLAYGEDRPAKGGWWALAGTLCFFLIPPFHVGRGVAWYLWEDIYVMAALAFLGLVACTLRVRRRQSVVNEPAWSP